jgi:hypothetical protein
MGCHVLVLAMSTLSARVLSGPSAYKFKAFDEAEKESSGEYVGEPIAGLGQMEVIPKYLKREYEAEGKDTPAITHIVILQTPESTKPAEFFNVPRKGCKSAEETCQAIRDKYDGTYIDMGDLSAISAVEFFKRRMKNEGIEAEFIPIDVNTEKPETGMHELQTTIRNLYARSEGDWKLWLDIHGGFRDISMVMFGLLQMLAAPDEQDLGNITSVSPDISAYIKHFNDQQSTVPVDEIYTIEHDPETHLGVILERTSFYRTFAKPAITAYMNYGQYAQMALRSSIDIGHDPDPYAFISYRRIDATSERYTFLGVLKKNDYLYWYDDSIKPLDVWRDDLITAVDKCTVFFALITRRYYESLQCVKELKQAIKKGKLVIFVSLDQTTLYKPQGDIHIVEDDDEVTLPASMLAPYLDIQQFSLEALVHEGVFQESELKKRLEELCAIDEGNGATFKLIHDDERN